MSEPIVPTALGYRMPAEWEPHAATWLSWPHNRDSWPGMFDPIPAVWVTLVRTLAATEAVHVAAGGAEIMAQASAMLGCTSPSASNSIGVTLHDIPTNDAWMRDHGPMFLAGLPGSEPALVHWGYNAWGGKYPPFDLDRQVPLRIAEILGYRRFEPGIILEGGAVDVNGRGSMLTTEQCLLNPNRNPGLTREDIERYLADYCAATHVVWLGEGIAGDDTDGHIDELARFVAPRVVAAAVEDDPADVNYGALKDNLRRLELATDEQGRKLEIVKFPMPRPLFFGEQRLPASYMNFYIANGVVVAPQFGDAADQNVLDKLAAIFPQRRVVGLPAVELAWGLGAFHCITQQQPAL